MYDSGQELFSVLYELVRFSLFVILSWYLFKLYLLPYFTSYIEEQEEELTFFSNKKRELDEKIHLEKHKIDQQAEFLKNLEKKIKLMHQQQCEEALQRQLELAALYKTLQEKKKIQNSGFEKQKIQQEVLHKALSGASEQLKKSYKDQKGEPLLEMLIQQIDKKVSSS